MNIKEIREIIELMNENNLREFELERDGQRISLKRGPSGQAEIVSIPQMSQVVVPHNSGLSEVKEKQAEKIPENVVYLESPMVGTFYAAPAPDAASFAVVGQAVAPNDVVCIIEAMKVMNEIKAEVAGVIKEILVKNGEPVEFGQPLFVVEKS